MVEGKQKKISNRSSGCSAWHQSLCMISKSIFNTKSFQWWISTEGFESYETFPLHCVTGWLETDSVQLPHMNSLVTVTGASPPTLETSATSNIAELLLTPLPSKPDLQLFHHHRHHRQCSNHRSRNFSTCINQPSEACCPVPVLLVTMGFHFSFSLYLI